MNELMKQLQNPFPAKDIEWRAGSTNRDKTKAMALAYITSRAVQDRLDEVFTVGGWRDNYVQGPNGGLQCELSCLVDGKWITKCGLADNTQFEAVKGGESGALKRAAVKFGIGRYLYNLDASWVACEKRGQSVILSTTPRLPAWALPNGKPAGKPQQGTTTPKQQEKPATVNSDALEIKYSDKLKAVTSSDGTPYYKIDTADLSHRLNSLSKYKEPTDEQLLKIKAIKAIFKLRQ